MKTRISFVIILIIFLLNSSAKSQWIPSQGIEGCNCHSITQQDSFLFITGPGGIYRRQIDDPTWDSTCLMGGFVKICSTGNGLFCLGGNTMSSFYRSLDNGFTWELLDLDYSYRDFENVDSFLFINTDGDGLIRTSDNGESWTAVDPSPNSAEIECIYSQQGVIFCLLENIDTLFESVDYGYSWTTYCLQNISEGHPYLHDGNLWLASENHFYIYNAQTHDWWIQPDSLPIQVYLVNFIEDSETLCCYTNDGFFRFNEQNLTWENVSQGLENRWCLDACRVDGSIYMATASGPFSKNGDEEWIPQYDDLFGWEISQVFVVGSRIYALANGKIYYSDDISIGFEILETQNYCTSRKMVITDTAWYLGSNCGFSVSVDSGRTWSNFNTGIEGRKVFNIAIGQNYFYAEVSQPSGHGLFRSGNDAMTWEKVPNEFGSTYFHDLAVINNDLFVILGSNSGLYKSTDNGTTFEAIPEVGYENSGLFVKNNKIFILRNYDDVIYSPDLGISWQTWISGVDDYAIMSMDITDNEETTVLGGFIGPWEPHSYLTLFSPEYPSGVDILNNIPAYDWSAFYNVLFDNGRIYACPSSGGLWYRDDLMVGVEDNEFSKPSSSSQLIIYPNPAKDFININYDKNIQVVEYQVFDYSGRMMMKGKINDKSDEWLIDVSSLSPGIYLIFIIGKNENGISSKFLKTNY